MKKRTLSVSFLVLFLASACGSLGVGGGGGAPPELQYIFQVSDNPISVSPTLDSQRVAEAVIPVSGGTLSVTAADGTVFRLDVPASALAIDTLVRMIPVSGLEGMPFGSDPLAVQLEPEGLQFYEFATLTITPVQNIPIDQQIVFGYQEDGKDLILATPLMDSSEIQIQVLHFSGNGVTKGLLADIGPVRERLGGAAERRLESALNEALIRSKQEGGDAQAVLDAFTGTWRQYEEQVLKPRLAAAGESCAAGQLALQTVLGLERQRQLLGAEGSSLQEILIDNGLMETVSRICLKEEYELCRDDHIIHRILPVWLGLARQYAILGAAEGSAPIPAVEEAKDYVRRCLTFEMQFQSQMDFDDGGGGGYTSSVESQIDIQFDPADTSTDGQAPLVNTAFEFIATDCSVTSSRGGGTFDAMSLSYITDTKSPTDELGYVRDLVFGYYPGDTSEGFTITCEDQPPFTSPPSPLWTGGFLVLHEAEMSQAAGGFVMEDWEILGGEYYAKREWINEDASLGITEAGTFKLYHRPE
jgi:hypothetical protein